MAGIVEPQADRAEFLREKYKRPVFSDIPALLHAVPNLTCASVCTPTLSHYESAASLLQAGVDVLVEKPISETVEQAEALQSLAQQHHRILQVGHLERFNPAVQAALPLLTRPMFFEAHRLSTFSPRSLDIDVVLDLMIHDLDIVLSFARSLVVGIHAVGLPVLSKKIDIANVRVEFESGCVANFTASRVSTEKVRKLRFFQPAEYLSIDYARRDLLRIAVDADALAKGIAAGESLPPGLSVSKPVILSGEPLMFELQAFLNSVRTRTEPLVGAQQGRAALHLAQQIGLQMSQHAQRAQLHTLQS